MDYTTTARLSSWPTRLGVGKLCCRINNLWQYWWFILFHDSFQILWRCIGICSLVYSCIQNSVLCTNIVHACAFAGTALPIAVSSVNWQQRRVQT